MGNTPGLPGNLTWGNRGIKVLGVYLGSEDFQRQNWDGVLEKVEAKLLFPQLSYRGRILIANNLVAPFL